MKKFFSFIVRQSVAVVLIVVFVLAFGIYSTLQMPVNLLPDINVPMVCVQVIYAGANAKSVEEDVTVRLEEGLSAIGGITSVDSYSYDNLSAVVLSFDYGTDTGEKKSDIQSKLASIDLPDNVITSVYDIDLNAEALAVLSVTSEKGGNEAENLENAYAAAKQLSSKLSAIDGVESVEIKGGAEYSYLIQPFGGLESVAPLLVQAFSYGTLDIPLGNVSQNGGNVQIRNNSDVASVGDIENMPVALPSAVVTPLTSVKQIMRYYESETQEELQTLRDDLGTGVIAVLHDVGGMTADELDALASLKTYMNLADSSADLLTTVRTSRYYDAIQTQVEGKTDEELSALAEDLGTQYPLLSSLLTVDLLKAVRDGKLDQIIAFRTELEQTDAYLQTTGHYSLTDEDYIVLETRYMRVFGEEFDYENLSDADAQSVRNRIDFVKKTSSSGLSAIAEKKRTEGDGYVPTDAECVRLFTGTSLSLSHPVILSTSFMAFVRNENYESNMDVLVEYRGKFAQDNTDAEGVERSVTAAQYFELYQHLDLTGVMEFPLSEELIGFILGKDLTALSADAEGNSVLIVSVSEIATVRIQEDYSSYVYYSNGAAALVKGTVIEIYKSNGANSSAVVQQVKSVFAEYAAGDGAEYAAEVRLLDDQSEFISDSISNVLVSMLIGGALAVIVIFLFLKKVRLSLIIAVTMPLSVLAALVCMFLMGITLNMVSLGGLAVGIGMLVDNSIVVIESISKHRDRDKSAMEAAVDGTVEVGGALLGSTLTTVCVFIPIIFTGGLTAEIFTDLSWAVIFSLVFSLLVAITVIPTLYAMLGGGKGMLRGGRLSKSPEGGSVRNSSSVEADGKTEEPVDERTAKKGESVWERLGSAFKKPRIMNGINAIYGKILPAVLNKKLVTILTAVVVFGASIGLLLLTGTEFLPSIDKGQIEINMSYGSTSQLGDVEADVFAFAETVREEIDNIDYISVSVGKNGMLALTDTGIITLQLTTNRGTSKVVERIRSLAQGERKPSGTVTVREIDGVVASLMSGASNMSVTVVGDDGETLKEIAQSIDEKLKENGFYDIESSATESSKEVDLKFNRTKMAELGLDYQTTVLTLRIGLASYTACTVTIEGQTYDLNVRFADGAVADIEGLRNFVVGSDNGAAVKLEDVCEISEVETEACIRRSDGRRMISVSASKDTDTGSASKEMQSIAAAVLADYEGYSFESSGISSYLTDAFAGLAVALVISFFLLYAVMAVQFGSFVQPLIVMASIPFSFTGGFLALVITGTSLNVVSFIGLIMLMGVVVNNAIVMLEKIKQLYEEGLPHAAAVQEACKTRLRPILMTTLTTILALIPMAVGVGQGSELMQPLGIVVIGGLLLGTLVTLVLVPAVYCAIHRISAKN